MSRLQDFDLISSLGKGSFGTVAKCVRRSDGEVYAMKQIKLQKLKDKDKKNALNEVRILASIQHQYIVSYKEAFYDQPSETLCVVMQYANEGDLDVFYISIQGKVGKNLKVGKRFPQNDIWKVAYQSLLGLSRLHDCNIIHRDIKSANIFFHNGDVKLGDLNVAKHLKDKFTATQTGTPYYASPQVWNEQPYDYKSDIWSLGCVLYEMAMLKPPFKAQNAEALYHKVTLGLYDRISSIYSNGLSELIGKCLTVDQGKRMSAKQLLDTELMRDIKASLENNYDQITEDELLNTIDFPKNMNQLNSNLPKPKYQSSSGVIRKVQTAKKLEFGSLKSPSSKRIFIPSIKLIGSGCNPPPSDEKYQAKQIMTKQGDSESHKRTSRVMKILIKQANNKLEI